MIFLDIETSGLDPIKDFITCIGILPTDQGIMQFSCSAEEFRSDPQRAEQVILLSFTTWLEANASRDLIASYNGDAFDIPFMKSRCFHHDIIFPSITHLDIFPFIQRIHGRRLSKDDAARRYCDLYIPSNSSGAFLARIYSNRKATDMQHLLMLQHNAIDLVTTARLCDSLSQFDDFQKWKEEML